MNLTLCTVLFLHQRRSSKENASPPPPPPPPPIPRNFQGSSLSFFHLLNRPFNIYSSSLAHLSFSLVCSFISQSFCQSMSEADKAIQTNVFHHRVFLSGSATCPCANGEVSQFSISEADKSIQTNVFQRRVFLSSSAGCPYVKCLSSYTGSTGFSLSPWFELHLAHA